MIFDIYDDPSLEVLRSSDWQKVAHCHMTKKANLDSFEDKDFALIVKTASGETLRKYPIKTEHDRMLSEFYFEKVSEELPDHIREAVDMNGASQITQMEKIAEPQCFGLEVDGWRYYPIDTEELTKQAASTFHISSQHLLPEERYEYAQNIIKQAESLGILDDIEMTHIRPYSGTEFSKAAWRKGIVERSQNCLESEKVAALKSYVPDGRDPMKVVAYLESWDKNAGLKSDDVLDPYASVFGDPLCKREQVKQSSDWLSSVPEGKLQDSFGDDFVEEWKKDPQSVYDSLPTPVKNTIQEWRQ